MFPFKHVVRLSNDKILDRYFDSLGNLHPESYSKESKVS